MMPKGKRKGRGERAFTNGSAQTSDEDDFNDNASVFSNVSENKSQDDNNDDAEDIAAQEQFEDSIIDAIDGLSQKSSQGRINCIQTIRKAFIKKFMPNFVRERYFTICDSIERILKKGNNLEKSAAAELINVVCFQLAGDDLIETVSKIFEPVLVTLANDNSCSAAVRSQCCMALGFLGFIAGQEPSESLSLMKVMENIFSGSYLKGDGSVPNVTPEMANLHATALNCWSLLFTVVTTEVADLVVGKNVPSLKHLSELLESPYLEIRLTAGEALALIFEEGRENTMDFASDFAAKIGETFKNLATDSHKYRAKKDRKQQRATFRDILQFFEDDYVPEIQVKFGKELLVLDTWAKRKHYEVLCQVLGAGINMYLTENEFLRNIFDIEAVIPSHIPPHAQNQMDRYRKRLKNTAASKARTISRGKNRDKRSDF